MIQELVGNMLYEYELNLKYKNLTMKYDYEIYCEKHNHDTLCYKRIRE